MSLKIFNKYFLIILFIFNATVQAQDVHLLGINDLFKLGIENSLKVKADKVNENIAVDEEATAKTGLLPDITVGLIGGYIGDPTVFKQGLTDAVHPYMPDWSQSYNVEVVQPLYRGGKIKRSIEKAALQKELAQLTARKDIAEMKLVLIGRYLDLFRLYKQQEVMNRNIEEAKQRLHDIQQMKKQGMVTGNDLIRSELQLTNYNLTLREVEDNIRISSQQLDIALGLNEDLLLKPDNNLLEQPLSLTSYEEYVQQASSQYPELRLAENGIKLARKNEEMVRADNLPSLSLRAANTLARPITTTSPAQDMYLNSWNVSLVLSYKLSGLYQNKKKVSAAKHSVTLQQIQREQQEQNIRTGIKSAFIRHKEATDRVDALTLSVEQANDNYRIVYNKYKNKLAVLTDILDASGVKLEAEMQLTTAKANVMYTYYQLLRASGNL
ncbi:TolC family protein [uncultured Bacteroides sp.]|uniref:TolC family protein n=1 Tax=uncultured Bacteroides sp. TaxID=162156 RepID=UPI002AA611DA|nr:TolC family protein [uncultured Bacteroides sp.]